MHKLMCRKEEPQGPELALYVDLGAVRYVREAISVVSLDDGRLQRFAVIGFGCHEIAVQSSVEDVVAIIEKEVNHAGGESEEGVEGVPRSTDGP